MTQWLGGIGQTLGDDLVTQSPLIVSGTVYFLSSATGSDANSGLGSNNPFATFATALAACSANDTIVVLSDHNETFTSGATLSLAGLTIVGAGSSSGVPTAKFTMNNAANASLFTVSAAGVSIRNIKFLTNSQANTAVRISVTGANFRLQDCYFECDQYDDNSAVGLGAGADSARLKGCTFISTATSLANRPYGGLRVTAAVSDLELDGVTFDGGSYGFSNDAFQASAAATTRLRAEGVSLLRGADAHVNTSTVGWAMPTTTTGSSFFRWAV